MSRSVSLTLGGDLESRRIEELKRSISADLSHEGQIEVGAVARPAKVGERAVGIDAVGQLLVTVLGSGGVIAFINCLRAHIERERSLRLHFEREDGMKLEIDSKNLSPEVVERTIDQLRVFLG